MMVSAIRATGAQVDMVYPLGQQLANLGEPLYRKLEPTGYASKNAEWVSSSALLARMNFALSLGQNKVQGIRVDTSRLNPSPEKAAQQLLFVTPQKQTLAALNAALTKEKQKNPNASHTALLAGLVLGSPEFQRK
jgi:uncharacterized protein (DUF1800 family)